MPSGRIGRNCVIFRAFIVDKCFYLCILVGMKMKIYTSSAVWLSNVPDKHAGNNGNKQFPIIVRTTTKKRVAELTGNSLRHLNEYGGLQARTDDRYGYNGEHVFADIVKKDNVIYYQPEHCRLGFIREWFEYKPRKT